MAFITDWQASYSTDPKFMLRAIQWDKLHKLERVLLANILARAARTRWSNIPARYCKESYWPPDTSCGAMETLLFCCKNFALCGGRTFLYDFKENSLKNESNFAVDKWVKGGDLKRAILNLEKDEILFNAFTVALCTCFYSWIYFSRINNLPRDEVYFW